MVSRSASSCCRYSSWGSRSPRVRLRLRAKKASPTNVVLDATRLDGAAVEPLYKLLDDHKTLVAGADALKLAPHMRVLLFHKDFAAASPALVSRLGMVSAL